MFGSVLNVPGKERIEEDESVLQEALNISIKPLEFGDSRNAQENPKSASVVLEEKDEFLTIDQKKKKNA